MGKKTECKSGARTGVARMLTRGVPRRSRSASFRKKAGYKFTKLGAAGKKTDSKVAASPCGESKWYQAEDCPKPLSSRKGNRKPTKLRASITPGTVLIVLAGKKKGKRVVFLKQLSSGLLLVTGPYKVNGVPLRRFNQCYVVATSTKIDVSGVDVADIDDEFFARAAAPKKTGGSFLESEAPAYTVSAARKDRQGKVDAVLMKEVSKVANLKSYLNAKFTLTKGQYPHLMKF